MGDNGDALLNRKSNKFQRCVSHAHDELQIFRSYLRWMFVDQSNVWRACLSWCMFILFGIVVPAISHFVFACATCDGNHKRPYDSVVELSLSSVATVSFVCLSWFVRKFGLRRFLFFDKLYYESETVRREYTAQLNRSMKILSIFVLPCFFAESVYKIWWYTSGFSQVPFVANVYVSSTVACILELCSWLYRTTVFFLVCVLFRLICYLQILRLQDFATVFQVESDVASIMSEHLRIRRHLTIISHRFRGFILWSLTLITGSQFALLLITTKSSAAVDYMHIFRVGELVLCSITLVTGLLLLLRSATKITHKAQAVACLATKCTKGGCRQLCTTITWRNNRGGIANYQGKNHGVTHLGVCATLESFDGTELDSPTAQIANDPAFYFNTDEESDGDLVSDEDNDLENTKMVPSCSSHTISYQKRQALVTYFENNKAGITVYGFTLDRTTLHMLFMIEFSLILWLLGKTINGIS